MFLAKSLARAIISQEIRLEIVRKIEQKCYKRCPLLLRSKSIGATNSLMHLQETDAGSIIVTLVAPDQNHNSIICTRISFIMPTGINDLTKLSCLNQTSCQLFDPVLFQLAIKVIKTIFAPFISYASVVATI